MALRIVTDSTCDLPPEMARSLEITVLPCNVHFGDEVYRDGVDLTAPEFYRRLAEGGVYPTTSQPSVGLFVDAYRKLAKEADQVLSVHISSKLSGACHSARLAREEMKGRPEIEVVDSQQVSLGLGLPALEVARMARQGCSLAEARSFLQKETPKVTSYCTVETLEYLVRGGRASRLQGFLGSLLQIRPIIMVKGGETHAAGRVRSRKKAIEGLVKIVAAQKGLRALGVLHGACQDEAEALANGCASYFPRDRMVLSEFSAVMGAHLGPRALGLGLWASS